MSATCKHLDRIELAKLPGAIAGGEDCLAIGRTWSWCCVDTVALVVSWP
jgi:hypothetical protein